MRELFDEGVLLLYYRLGSSLTRLLHLPCTQIHCIVQGTLIGNQYG
jgi:hypothetical protein